MSAAMPHQAHFGPDVWPFAIPILIGMALGGLVALALRWFGLGWTWALLGAPLAYLAWLIAWPAGLAIAVGGLVATWVSVHIHADGLHRGAEEARAKREAPGPLALLRSSYAARRARIHRERPGSYALGTTRSGAVYRVPIAKDAGVHALILGATGSGKTVTQTAIAQAHIRAGKAAIVIDPKGDPAMMQTLRRAAAEAGARFRGWSPSGPNPYNPLARGEVTEIADKALAAHEWSEPHYELATQRLLGFSLSTMRAANKWPPTLASLVRYMNLDALHDLAEKVGGSTSDRVSAYLNGLSARGADDLVGGRDRLAVLAESDLGRWLGSARVNRPPLDLEKALRDSEVLYFYLDADRYPAASKLLGAAIVIDLVNLSAAAHGPGGLLLFDEFAALAAPHVSRLFARARSSGLSLLLGTQSLGDIRAAQPDQAADTLVEQLISNVSYVVAHRVADPDSADYLARVAGTQPSWSMTERVGGSALLERRGEGTRTREREFVIGPDQFKRLDVGEAVVIDPKTTPAAQVVDIWPADGVLR